MENALKGPSWHSEKCFQPKGTCGEQGNRIKKIHVHTEIFSRFTLPLPSAFFMPKSLPNSSLYPPSYVPFPCAPRSFSLFFLSISHFFFFSIVCQPTCLHGNSVWKGCVVLMISPTCWNFVTFLTLLRGSYCELDHRTFGSHACFLSF